MSLSAPEDAFLDVNDAHLRVYGNVHADGLKLGQLEIVTTTSTGSTIQFLHQHTAFTTTSNIEVGTTNHDLFVDTENSKVGILTNTPTEALDVNGTVKATAFDGNGALLTGIPSSAINGTLSQWTTVAGPKIHYSDGNVGIGIADPLHTLDVVGDINFTGTLREDGNPFVSTPWTIESGPTALSYTLGNVGVGGTTPSAKLEVTGNAHVSTDLSVGGNLTINTISAAATHGLGAVTALSNTSADTVLLTNTGTSLVTSGNVTVGKELTVTGNVTAPFMTGLGYLSTKTHTFDPTDNTSKYFLGWTQEEGMEIEIQDNGYNHGGLNRFYITFHWGGMPILSSADISELKKYNFYYTYKFDRLYLWFNETLATDPNFPNVTYTIRMKTLKNPINLTEPGASEQYISTTIGVSAALILSRISIANIGSQVGVGTTTPKNSLHVYKAAAEGTSGLFIEKASGGAGTTAALFFGVAATSETNYNGIPKAAIFYERNLVNGRGDIKFCNDEIDDTNPVSTAASDTRMIIKNNGDIGVGTVSPSRTLDVHGSARPGGFPFAIGGTWSNRAHYVSKTHFPGVNKSSYTVDFLIGGSERMGWLRACAGGSQSGSGTIVAAVIAEFIISPYGTNFYSNQKDGSSGISISSSGTHNGGRITVSHASTSYPRLWFEIYHEYGVYW